MSSIFNTETLTGFASGLHALVSLLILAGGVTRPASAQVPPEPAQEDTIQVFEIAPVVVTASGSEVDIRNAPASVSVVQRAELERQPVQSLGEILTRLPGVTGGLSPNGEMSKIRLRGLPENYTLLLVDGRRLGTSRDVTYRPDMGRQDLNWIAPESIERIEIVRGPMSALYGSDAMGGVVNIITRPVTPDWHGSLTSSFTLPGETDRGEAYKLSPSLAGPLTQNLGLKVGAGYSRQNADDVDLGGRGETFGASGVTDRTANAELVWSPSGSHVLTVGGSYGLQESLAPSVPNADGEEQSSWGPSELRRLALRAGYKGSWSFGTTRLDLYRNRYDNEVGDDGEATAGDLTVEGALTLKGQLGVPHGLTLGGQIRREEITNTRTIGTVPVDYEGRAVEGAELTGTTSAFFAEDQMAFLPELLVTAGARLDHHEKYGGHLSPRIYGVYHPVSAVTVRGGVSRGFRAPTLKESSAGAATYSRGGGCGSLEAIGYTGGGCYMAGNPELEPEESTSWEVGLAFDRSRLSLGATYFHTDFENKIEYMALGFNQGQWWTRMENVERARTKGVEATATLPLTSALTWRTNATWMIEAKNLDTGEELITTPELSAHGSLDWSATAGLTLSLSAQYTGSQLGAPDAITDAYTMIDQSTRFRISDALSVRGGVQNLFATEISSETGYDYYQPGRRFFAAVTTRF